MALARCKVCGCPSGKGGNTYSERPRLPVGFPDSGVVCGTQDCLNPEGIYLTQGENAEYENGIRVFEITAGHRATKFKIQ